VPCHITYTNEEAHEAIRANLHRAPLYSGAIEGVGPRYCPSIEDKVVRFAHHDRHQIFLEPEGLDTSWIYLNGISTSLPRDVQDTMLRAIPALRNARVHQYGYAVEYDFFPPTQIDLTFETRAVAGLYFAGQICGTSGYEEAAAQGFLAGVNAVLKLRDREPVILDRSQAYIGVLVDDLVRECPREPYRMFTSRAEHRLLLRSDNADLRLMETGHRLGLIPGDAFARVERKRRQVSDLMTALEKHRHEGKELARLLRQPERRLGDVLPYVPELAGMKVDPQVAEEVEIEVKYAAYIERQRAQVERFRSLEGHRIPRGIEYRSVVGMRGEAREKLARLQPHSVGQASRIAGVTPADVAVLMAHLKRGQKIPGQTKKSQEKPRKAKT
jgi:tRNA uridine 5-carboxymethylaminomethyl modification enzyme